MKHIIEKLNIMLENRVLVPSLLEECIQDLSNDLSCDGCAHQKEQMELREFSLLPDTCRSCRRMASDRYERV